MVQSARSRRSPQARAERADRILDAAGDLMVSLGPNKITIEDVARRAGVGKGTVYLHFPTKEVLFLVVFMRAQHETASEAVRRMGADPAEILPSRLGGASLEALWRDRILRELFMGETALLDTVTETAAEEGGGLLDMRIQGLEAYLHLLREHGLVRTDLPADELLHAFGATLTGFLVYPSLLENRGRSVPPPQRRARLAAEAVRGVLGEQDRPEALRAAWPQVVALFDHTVRRIGAEIDRYRTVRRE